MNEEPANVMNFNTNWLNTFVGGYENNPKFNQLYVYYFMDVGTDNLTECENYINAIKTQHVTYDGDWKLAERQIFYYSYANNFIKTQIDTLLASFLPSVSTQVFSYSTMTVALQALAIQGRPIFTFFMSVSDANVNELKTIMDESYLSSMLGQVVISTSMNAKLGFTGDLIIEYTVAFELFAIHYEIYIYRRNDLILEDRIQKYFFKIDFV